MDIIIYDDVTKIPPRILKQLQRLNYSTTGGWFRFSRSMKIGLNKALKFKHWNTRTKLFLIKSNDAELVLSWAMVQKYSRTNEFSVFTRRTERRKGYGKALYNEAIKFYTKLHVLPHDDRSKLFYKSVAKPEQLTRSSKKRLEEVSGNGMF